ncbi:MAG TPA: GAF domain-containing sensor histidine kinase [Chloroflexia bacterium]|jgi:signal transduction histidine kinase
MSTLDTISGPEHRPEGSRAGQPDTLRVRQLLALNQAAIAITGELELDKLLQRIVDVTRALIGCHYAALGVLGEDGYIARFPTSGISETDREKIGAPPRGHGLLGVMLRAGRTLRVPDINKDPRRIGFPRHHPPMTALLGVPIFVQGKLVGTLYLTDKHDAADFTEEDEWLVQLLAIHAATALTNAALHDEAQRGREAAEREQKRLRELEQMKDEFLSTAAHELRTPLTTIKMSAGLALEQLKRLAALDELDPRIVDLVALVVEGSERMHSLVNDLLDLTRLEQGRITLHLEELDVRDVITEAVQATKPLFESKGQELAVRLPEAQCAIRGDRQRLEQVLINLLSNAHKYTPNGSKVEIRAARSAAQNPERPQERTGKEEPALGRRCVVIVRDNGPGVPPDEVEHIFERFYRSSLHRNDRTASTGLGLPIARTVAEIHGGRLWVESAPGGGSLFTLALPTLP